MWRQTIAWICEAVSTRAAHLSAVALATLVARVKRKHVTIATDGSLVRKHPYFRSRIESKMAELVGEGVTFELRFAEDGSGIGAALVAATVAHRLKIQRENSNNNLQKKWRHFTSFTRQKIIWPSTSDPEQKNSAILLICIV